MAGNFTCIVNLLCNLAVFCCSFGLFVCDTFGTNGCPGKLEKGQYLRVHGDKCYKFITKERSWPSARDYCRESGGQLISITRRDIQLFVEQTLHEIWSRNRMWIGAHDRDSEMDWFWVTGEKVNSGFQNWDKGQPSCSPPFQCFEDCACLRVDMGYKWHDYLCSLFLFRYGFACEYNLLPVPEARRRKTTVTTTTTTAATVATITTTLPTTTTPSTTTTTSSTRTTTTTTVTPLTTVVRTQSPTYTETGNENPKAFTKRTTRVNTISTSEPSTVANASFQIGPDSPSGIVMTKLPVTGIVVGTLAGMIIIVIMTVLLTIIIRKKMLTSRLDRRLTNTQQISQDRNEMVFQAKTQVSGSDGMKMAESAYDNIDDYYHIDIDHTDGSVHAYEKLEAETKHGMKMAESAYDNIDDYYHIDIDHTDGSVHAYEKLEAETKHSG